MSSTEDFRPKNATRDAANELVKNKVLIIRFSSFGDVLESLSLPSRLRDLPGATEVHWVTRSEFKDLISGHPSVARLWTLERKTGLRGLWKLILELRREHFTHIYDAHNNLRSRLICLFVRAPHFLRKSQRRWQRFLLFQFRWNLFPQPFSGQGDLLGPLSAWGLSPDLPPVPQLFLPQRAIDQVRSLFAQFGGSFAVGQGTIALAPSAAYPLKRWPLSYWQELITKTNFNFILLGGPEDDFLEKLREPAPDRVLNLAGKLSLIESAAAISLTKLLIANDTGLLHVAEQIGKPCIALMGPAPFGYPSRPSTQIMELNLACRPCSKHGQGPCVNSIYQQCLVGISVERVLASLNVMMVTNDGN